MTDITRAREIASRCWLDSRTRRIPVDPALVEVFAERLMALTNSAEALYMAGRWTLEDERIQTTDQKQTKLWEDLRDALGLKPGPALPEVDTAEIVSGQTVSVTS